MLLRFSMNGKLYTLPLHREYTRIFGLNKARAKWLKPGALIAPGPINRGVEMTPARRLAQSVILEQVPTVSLFAWPSFISAIATTRLKNQTACMSEQNEILWITADASSTPLITAMKPPTFLPSMASLWTL